MQLKQSNYKPKSNIETTKRELHFDAIGTSWDIQVPNGINSVLAAQISQTISEVDLNWSRFRSDSLVAKMATTAGEYDLGQKDLALLQWYKLLYDVTSGAVTPLIGQTLSDAGYDSSYSLRLKASLTKTPAWNDRLILNKASLTVLKPTLLDVGAAGKGYLVDLLAGLLPGPYVIDAGGDIRIHKLAQVIGLENPSDTTTIIGTVSLSEGSICGSAGNRRAWQDSKGANWHHIISPFTSRPTDEVKATWAIADSAMVADGLATALFFIDARKPEELRKLSHIAEFQFVVVYSDGVVVGSDNANIKLF